MSGMTTVEDAHGNEVEVPVGMDGENPISPNNPAAKAVTGRVRGIGSQPFEGSIGDGQSLLKAALGEPGQPDDENRPEVDPNEQAEAEKPKTSSGSGSGATKKTAKKTTAKTTAKKTTTKK